MKNLAFIVHGKIKRREKIITQIKETFDGFNTRFFITGQADDSIELAGKALRDGATHIICVGGDGSLNEVANGVMRAKEQASKNDTGNTRLGLLPHGTGNDFAKTIKTNDSVQNLKQFIDNDSYREIDLGLAEYRNVEGQQASRYFVNITDVGMGGVIARKLKNSSKAFGATLTYQKVIISTLLSYHNLPVKAKADNFEYEGSVMNFIVANGKYFGAGMGIAPDALPDDGLFSVVIAGEISVFDYLKNLGDVRKCVRIKHPGLQYLSASRISIESPGEALPIDMDGEFIGTRQ